MHNQCPKGDEWSGLLIYKVEEGDIEKFLDPNNKKEYLELRAEAVFPMDYGTATFTSFEGNEDWLKCFATFPDIDPINPTPGWYIGKIHSHNTMPVFHSAVDKTDLYQNAHKLPMFLSLIVNYACEVDCELAVPMEAEETVLTRTILKLKGWGKQQKKIEKKKSEHKPVYLVKCDVVYEQDVWLIEQAEALKTKNKPTWQNNYNSDNKDKNVIYHGKTSPRIYRAGLDCISDLITLGHAPGMAPVDAVREVGIALFYTETDQYKKAIKQYFMAHWFDETFLYTEATPGDAIEAALEFIEHHNQLWLYKFFKEALNELKEERFKLWPIQGLAVVR